MNGLQILSAIFLPQEPIDPQKLADHSPLDLTQSTALLNSLLRGVSLIQGPPGTGKSYTGEKIIKVLLANKKRADLGPILVSSHLVLVSLQCVDRNGRDFMHMYE
ncbi:hypothetical protein BKA67DRAFT_519285 [Truncatella angustata]|uniref:DNA2/NAM7 helicase helicase domain-containing protein n=1 Tax=Truncatella angustata TaxID=152316 RepID=A0A9P8ZWC3_9PEZI|nr:uncharacterized protein BKA67DRAFT_519285 [Truncatella angustata]KAH6653535.1 hypothetical protein BKA67DRAFT_519285 [Truncatella angustata]